MKTKRIFFILITFLCLIIYSCKDYEFNNPVDPEVPVINPNGLTLLNFTETQLKISWVDKTTFPEGTQKVVQFEQTTDGTNYTVAGYDTVMGNQAELNTLFEPDKEYKFRTFVYYSDKKTVLEGTLTGILALKPDSLKVTFDSDTTALVTWKDKSNYEKEFEIDVYENNNKIKTEIVNANTVSKKIYYNYVSEKDYKFEIKAKSENQNSTILNLTKRFTINAPTNLQITNFIESEAVLTWKDNSSLETGYEIEQSEDGTNYTLVNSVGANIQTATITGAFNIGETYSFRVRAKTNYNVSIYSNIVNYFVQFDAPSNLEITNFRENEATLAWNDNSSIEKGFEIEQSEDGTNYTLVKTVGENIQTAIITGQFNIGKTYSFRVRAKTNTNFTSFSNAVSGAYGLPEMVTVQGGTFIMGNSEDQGYYLFHSVTLSTFKIAKYEVTQKLWVAVMGTNPSYFPGDENRPIETVSWNDVQQFITKLNQMTGKTFRLPTEAEWEFVARGGNQSLGSTYVGSYNINAVAWYKDNSGNTTHPVGTKAPNELGIYDMGGNVWEWCQDWFSDTYYSVSPTTNPPGPSSGTFRVLRGGCWSGSREYCCSYVRYDEMSSSNFYDVGFRLAEDL